MSPRARDKKARSDAQKDEGIAQLGEHLPYKQRVSGSIPDAPTKYGPVVQLVRTLACHARGRGFESHPGRQMCRFYGVKPARFLSFVIFLPL